MGQKNGKGPNILNKGLFVSQEVIFGDQQQEQAMNLPNSKRFIYTKHQELPEGAPYSFPGIHAPKNFSLTIQGKKYEIPDCGFYTILSYLEPYDIISGLSLTDKKTYLKINSVSDHYWAFLACLKNPDACRYLIQYKDDGDKLTQNMLSLAYLVNKPVPKEQMNVVEAFTYLFSKFRKFDFGDKEQKYLKEKIAPFLNWKLISFKLRNYSWDYLNCLAQKGVSVAHALEISMNEQQQVAMTSASELNPEYHFELPNEVTSSQQKVLLLGEHCGKTTLIYSFYLDTETFQKQIKDRNWPPKTEDIENLSEKVKNMTAPENYEKNSTVFFKKWNDLSSFQVYDAKPTYRDVDFFSQVNTFVICFSLDIPMTMQAAKSCFNDISDAKEDGAEWENTRDGRTYDCLLVGLKSDVDDQPRGLDESFQRKISTTDAINYAVNKNMAYIELSAKALKNNHLPFIFCAARHHLIPYYFPLLAIDSRYYSNDFASANNGNCPILPRQDFLITNAAANLKKLQEQDPELPQ